MSDRLGVPLDANGELEPELSDEIDPDQLESDSASIVDSILAEHAAAEARYDASAIAEAAMSGGSSFGDVADDDMSFLSGGEMSTFGSKLPASEARSYVDAIRASVESTDHVELAAFSVADELMSESREPHMADASDESTASDEPHVGHDDSESMVAASDPHVGNDESMSASEPHAGHDDSSAGDSMSVSDIVAGDSA